MINQCIQNNDKSEKKKRTVLGSVLTPCKNQSLLVFHVILPGNEAVTPLETWPLISVGTSSHPLVSYIHLLLHFYC